MTASVVALRRPEASWRQRATTSADVFGGGGLNSASRCESFRADCFAAAKKNNAAGCHRGAVGKRSARGHTLAVNKLAHERRWRGGGSFTLGV